MAGCDLFKELIYTQVPKTQNLCPLLLRQMMQRRMAEPR